MAKWALAQADGGRGISKRDYGGAPVQGGAEQCHERSEHNAGDGYAARWQSVPDGGQEGGAWVMDWRRRWIAVGLWGSWWFGRDRHGRGTAYGQDGF